MSISEPRVALYSPGMIGLGHMRRNLNLVRRFAARYPAGSFLMLTEAREAGTFDFPDNVDCLTLPALRKDSDGRCSARRLNMDVGELTTLRADVITAALQRFAPDVLIVDHLPRGAHGELEPGLELLSANKRTRFVLGLRDVLEEPATVEAEWSRYGHVDAIRRFYEAVWIYGDPNVFDLLTECRLHGAIGEKARFTGYLNPTLDTSGQAFEDADGLAARLLDESPFVLCQVGGGQDGERLAQAFVDATLPDGLSGVLLTGPFMARRERDGLAHRARTRSARLHVIDFISEPAALLGRADSVIGMGGYNTICEVMSLSKRALIVPRVAPRREQLIRSERLARLGCIDHLPPETLSAEAISEWLCRPHLPPRARASIDMDGLNRASAYLEDIIEGRWAEPALVRSAAGRA